MEYKHLGDRFDDNVYGLVILSHGLGTDNIDPTDSSNNYTQMFQFCGGYLDPIDLSPQPYITANGTPTTEAPKGYLCPVQSICMENNNPYNGTVSFDNFAQSMELVFVIISTNTFTDLMFSLVLA